MKLQREQVPLSKSLMCMASVNPCANARHTSTLSNCNKIAASALSTKRLHRVCAHSRAPHTPGSGCAPVLMMPCFGRCSIATCICQRSTAFAMSAFCCLGGEPVVAACRVTPGDAGLEIWLLYTGEPAVQCHGQLGEACEGEGFAVVWAG